MRTPITLLVFLAGLAVLFGVAVSVGESIGPILGGSPAIPGSPDHGSDAEGEGQGHDHRSDLPGGLSVAEAGYVLRPVITRFSPGEWEELRFAVYGKDGGQVTEFGMTHERRMHLVVVRRDLTNYQHLHPTMDQDGTWTARLRFPEPGSYRAFAQFLPTGAAEPLTLGVDLEVPGFVDSKPVAQSSSVYEVGGLTVIEEGDLTPGRTSTVRMHVMRDDVPVTDLEPYLGALGHLVVLREGDLGYLHVHPVAGPQRDTTISFEVTPPSAGFYRMFFEFQHGGQVHTAQFTVVAG